MGEYVAVVLMAAAGGLLIAAAQDLLVIFVGLELLSLGLYILTAFAKSSGKSAEAALKYYLFGGMSAAFLLFGFSYLLWIDRIDEPAPDSVWRLRVPGASSFALCCAGSGRRRAGLQSRRGSVSSVGAGYLRGRARSGGGVYRLGFEGGELRAADYHQPGIG